MYEMEVAYIKMSGNTLKDIWKSMKWNICAKTNLSSEIGSDHLKVWHINFVPYFWANNIHIWSMLLKYKLHKGREIKGILMLTDILKS